MHYACTLAALVLCFSVLAYVRVLDGLVMFSTPIENTFGESIVVRVARDARDGLPNYRSFLEAPPHLFSLYGPLAYWIPALVARWLNLDEVGILLCGRALAAAAFVASIGIVAVMLRRSRVTVDVIVVAILAYVTAGVTWPVAMSFRPDTAELFFILLGLSTYVTWADSTRRYIALAPLLIAALFKQSAVIVPFALIAHELTSRGLGSALRFGLATALLYTATFVAIDFLYEGMFRLNMVKPFLANRSLSNAGTVTLTLVADTAFIVGLAWFGALRRSFEREVDAYTAYFLVAFAFAAATAMRDGSATNYFLAPMAVGTFILGRELSHESMRESGRIAVMTLALIMSAPLVYQEMNRARTLAPQLETRRERDQQLLGQTKGIAAHLNALGGPVLCQDNNVNLYLDNPLMFELMLFSGLSDRGVFDDSKILDLIRTNRIGAVVLQFPVSQPVPKYQSTDWVRSEWVDAVKQAGYVERRLAQWYVYTPRPQSGAALNLLHRSR